MYPIMDKRAFCTISGVYLFLMTSSILVKTFDIFKTVSN